MAQADDIIITRDLEYATHDGVRLIGDLYAPRRGTPGPALVAVHGGGWQIGDRSFYRHWGPYLARHGVALFSIEYCLSAPGKPSFPQAPQDVRAAVQYLRGRAGELAIDPNRIGLIGNSAGAHLSALVGLAGEDGPAKLGARVKTVVGFYGVYDLAAQWNHDLFSRPRDSIVAKFLGKPLHEDRRIYFEASPLSYATARPDAPAVFLLWGTDDDIVDHVTQSEAFRDALKQAGYFVRTAALAGAPHFWASDPLDEPGSLSGSVAPRLLRFLQERL